MSLMIYQEQMMLIYQVVAGFDAYGRDRLCKAIGKKLPAEMIAVGEAFIAGAVAAIDTEDLRIPSPPLARRRGHHGLDPGREPRCGADHARRRPRSVPTASCGSVPQRSRASRARTPVRLSQSGR